MNPSEINELLRLHKVADGYFIMAILSTILGRMIHYGLSDDEILSLTSGTLNILHSALKDPSVISNYEALTDALEGLPE